MSEIIKGRRYRIVETYDSGTTVTYEGIVIDVSEDVVAFESGGQRFSPWLRAYRKTDPVEHGVTVTVTQLAMPLPQALGSVIRYFWEEPDESGKNYQIQMRVPPVARGHGPTDQVIYNWRTSDGALVADPLGNNWELIYDPEEKR